jgi:hypothetical protein
MQIDGFILMIRAQVQQVTVANKNDILHQKDYPHR